MIKKIFITLAIVLVIAQFFGTEKNDAETRELTVFVLETTPNSEVSNILASKCYDCHSNKTEYPWYANVAPLSYWINHHVEEGKEHLNFSDWSTYNTKRKKHKLEELIEEVEEGKMPLDSYENLHGEISATEKEILIDWAKIAIANY
ncbi:cytochrome C [Wenyingzhuangia fucanilytica]|uniref:Cytochrome C n=1 Tax=Wenyingzhuangia fucanilytica TaxID=1790137 RepID=A0A1B1Y5H7_9FLAO|nr:heme-binding domain-containing protein [Wenyingzhuangia fucanilytica]ANW96004.1 cytochrome C [Wenyingzhuangia fucanilytica]